MRKPLIIQGYQNTGKNTIVNAIAEMYGCDAERITFTKNDRDIVLFLSRFSEYEYSDMVLVIVDEVPSIADLVAFHEEMKEVYHPIIYITQDTSKIPDDFNAPFGFNRFSLRRLPYGIIINPEKEGPLFS